MSFMSKAGLAVAALGLAAGSVVGAGSANAAGDLFGAIGFSPQLWESWSTVNWDTVDGARASVLDGCTAAGADDCGVMATWANGCGALVYNDQGWVAAASGPDRSEAIRKAIDRLSEGVPVARLANFGSSDLSGTEVIDVVCTANVR
ncbi:DUF4189 domain-containing protein [Nocardia sp. NPDC058176]|uniref:DUF4189 domain-containing protein n=1 Tax=Nocardia sp. NPDC058176 TaxID=3346368 RepID=UPI0036D7A7B4